MPCAGYVIRPGHESMLGNYPSVEPKKEIQRHAKYEGKQNEKNPIKMMNNVECEEDEVDMKVT